MENVEKLLFMIKAHADRYPLMQPQDAVKLLYQNEFGGGHLVRAQQRCVVRLQEEYLATPRDLSVPLLEDIGDGLFRVYLAPLSEDSVEDLGRAFILSAARREGSMNSFLEKLSLLPAIPFHTFSREELEAYIRSYIREGCPMVSHSEAYREAYHPSYRVCDIRCLREEGVL